jgi:hypothetical protein
MNICYEYLECVGYDNLFYADLLVNEGLRKELVLGQHQQRSTKPSARHLAPELSDQDRTAVSDREMLKLP